MSTDQKIDMILQYISHHWMLSEAIEEKNNNVRKQDFEAALSSRKKECELRAKLNQWGDSISELLKLQP